MTLQRNFRHCGHCFYGGSLLTRWIHWWNCGFIIETAYLWLPRGVIIDAVVSLLTQRSYCWHFEIIVHSVESTSILQIIDGTADLWLSPWIHSWHCGFIFDTAQSLWILLSLCWNGEILLNTLESMLLERIHYWHSNAKVDTVSRCWHHGYMYCRQGGVIFGPVESIAGTIDLLFRLWCQCWHWQPMMTLRRHRCTTDILLSMQGHFEYWKVIFDTTDLLLTMLSHFLTLHCHCRPWLYYWHCGVSGNTVSHR